MLVLLLVLVGLAMADNPELSFHVTKGGSDNYFYRSKTLSFNSVSTLKPDLSRFIVALPSENYGFCFLFKTPYFKLENDTMTEIQLTNSSGAKGVLLFKDDFELPLSLIGSMRQIRDYFEGNGITYPDQLPQISIDEQNTVTIKRTMLDKKSWINIYLTTNGNASLLPKNILSFKFSPGAPSKWVGFYFETNVPQMKGLDVKSLFNPDFHITEQQVKKEQLSFLTFEDKFLAGSWRFNTYFGRDTLMSTRLLMPALSGHAIESAFISVLKRLNENGEVAHEEDIGDWATWDHIRDKDNQTGDVYDYKMIDDNFMLLPIFREYSKRLSSSDMKRFLTTVVSEKTLMTVRDLLMVNARFVLKEAIPFTKAKEYKNLIRITHPTVGNWRDSDTGLGYGKFPFDVNVALVPAALHSIAYFINNGIFDGLGIEGNQVETLANFWQTEALPFFALEENSADSVVAEYSKQIGIPAPKLSKNQISYFSVAIHENGTKVKVMNTDVSFALLFLQNLQEDFLNKTMDNFIDPFPYGLITPIGLLVANPVFDDDLHEMFDRTHYHGTVVWSWQQALSIAGLDKQIFIRESMGKKDWLWSKMVEARRGLWEVVDRMSDFKSLELWSWKCEGGDWGIVPMSEASRDGTESNALQLWSTVFLALNK